MLVQEPSQNLFNLGALFARMGVGLANTLELMLQVPPGCLEEFWNCWV
jgi:hypothetical protein